MSDVRKARCPWPECHAWLAEIDIPSGRIVKLARNVVIRQARLVSDDPDDDRAMPVRRAKMDPADLNRIAVPGMIVTLFCSKCGRGYGLATPNAASSETTIQPDANGIVPL